MSGHVMDEDEVHDFLNNEEHAWVLRLTNTHVSGWLTDEDIAVTAPLVSHLRGLLTEVTLRGSVSGSDIIDAMADKLHQLVGKDLDEYVDALTETGTVSAAGT
ncbi:hypothetical protein BKG82_27170 [Mycobacteroides chelonae]|uniref:Uncharacterized protein n=1 Tax=Mycobacteroides chelonae TaxID=1774 RepID=A0A1S1LIV7_MYCCH|nr:hypothetical protein [Mycobacteroides chelonae]OHU47336.1 hypothetical protein BKG82_27170 [Mycobacteroides chelonae]